MHAIVLSNNDDLTDRLGGNLRRYAPTLPIHRYVGARSMCSGYNAALRRLNLENEAANTPVSPHDIVCLIHQDARLHFDFATIVPRYFEHLPAAGVLGFCGCKHMPFDSRWWVIGPLVGSIIQGGDDRTPATTPPNVKYDAVTQHTPDGLGYEPVDSVDGLCMFVRLGTLARIDGFDEHFDDWHCYDADLCMKCLALGARNYVIDQKVQHFSGGSSADPWEREQQKWIAKWTPLLKQRHLLRGIRT